MAEAKVAGKVVAVRENPDVQERVRLKIEELKQKNPKKYEEHKETFARLAEKLVKKDLEAEENQRKQDEALFERMRKKLSQAFYKELGIDENYIERHREQIERWERSVGKPQTIGDELDAAAGIAGGAVDNVNASRNKIGRYIGELAGLGLGPLLGTVESSIAAISTAFPPLGIIITAASAAMIIGKIVSESRGQQANRVGAANKIEEYKKKLEAFAAQLSKLESRVEQDKAALIEAAKTLKKADLNAYIENYVKTALKDFDLTATSETTKQIMEEVSSEVQAETQEEPKANEQTTKPKTEEEELEAKKKLAEEQAAQGGLS